MIITITGPSGSGKSSLVRILKRKYKIKNIVTATTRQKRKREKDGIDYHFLTEEEFSTTPMFESSTFGRNHYGTPEKDFFDALADDFDNVHVIIVDRNGAKLLGRMVKVFTVYISVDPEFAYANVARRSGKREARLRQKIDVENGLHISDGYDCILSNTMNTTKDELAYEFMNFVESRKVANKYNFNS